MHFFNPIPPGEYYSVVNIFQGWIFLRSEYFSEVNLLQGWIYFRGEYFSGVNILRKKIQPTFFHLKIFHFFIITSRVELCVNLAFSYFLAQLSPPTTPAGFENYVRFPQGRSFQSQTKSKKIGDKGVVKCETCWLTQRFPPPFFLSHLPPLCVTWNLTRCCAFLMQILHDNLNLPKSIVLTTRDADNNRCHSEGNQKLW